MHTDEMIRGMRDRFTRFHEPDYRRVFETMTETQRADAWGALMDGWNGTRPPPPKRFLDVLKTPKVAAVRNERGEWPWEERSRIIHERTTEFVDRWARENPDLAGIWGCRSRVKDKAHLMAMIEADHPKGHPSHRDGPLPENLLRCANIHLTGQDHDDWLTGDEIAAATAAQQQQAALPPMTLKGQGPKSVRAPKIAA